MIHVLGIFLNAFNSYTLTETLLERAIYRLSHCIFSTYFRIRQANS